MESRCGSAGPEIETLLAVHPDFDFGGWGPGQLDLLGFGRGGAPGRLACSLLAWVDPLCGRHDSSCFRGTWVDETGMFCERAATLAAAPAPWPRRGRRSGRFRYLQAGGQPLAISDLIGPHGPAPDCKRANPIPTRTAATMPTVTQRRRRSPRSSRRSSASTVGSPVPRPRRGSKVQRAGGMASRVFTLARGHQAVARRQSNPFS